MTAYMLWNGSAIRIENTNLDYSGLGSYPAIFDAFTIDLDKKGIPLEVFGLWLKERGRVVVSTDALDKALEDCVQSFVETFTLKDKASAYNELIDQLYAHKMADLFDWVSFEKRRIEEEIADSNHHAIEYDGQLYVFKKARTNG